MSAFIPQLDPDPELRQADLTRARSEYQVNYTYVSPLAIIERVPIDHEFSHEWLKLVGDLVLTALHNQLEIEGETHLADFLCAKHGLLEKILAVGADFFAFELRTIVTEALRFTGRMTAKPVRPTDLEDFASLFRTIG